MGGVGLDIFGLSRAQVEAIAGTSATAGSGAAPATGLYFHETAGKVDGIWLNGALVIDASGTPEDGSVGLEQIAPSLIDGAIATPGLRSLITAVEADAAHAVTAKVIFDQLDRIARHGLPEKCFWGLTDFFPKIGEVAPSESDLVKGTLFVPHRNMTIRGLSFIVNTAAGSNDECAVGVRKGSDGKTVLAASTATAGKLNVANQRIDIDFTADLALTAGVGVYVCHHYHTIGSTAAKLASWEWPSLLGQFAGSAAGSAFGINNKATFPFASEPAFVGNATNQPVLIVRER